jgi:hypothetical protein
MLTPFIVVRLSTAGAPIRTVEPSMTAIRQVVKALESSHTFEKAPFCRDSGQSRSVGIRFALHGGNCEVTGCCLELGHAEFGNRRQSIPSWETVHTGLCNEKGDRTFRVSCWYERSCPLFRYKAVHTGTTVWYWLEPVFFLSNQGVSVMATTAATMERVPIRAEPHARRVRPHAGALQ